MTTSPMASIAFASVKCLACQSCRIVSMTAATKLPRVCSCHHDEPEPELDVERAKWTIRPGTTPSSFAFEAVVANAAYVAALFGVVVLT